MELPIGLFGRIIIPFNAAYVALARGKWTPKAIQENDSLNQESGDGISFSTKMGTQ